MACCPKDGEPLVATMEWNFYEFVCMVCDTKYEFLQPTARAVTPELDARQKELADQYAAEREERKTQAPRNDPKALDEWMDSKP